MAEFKGDNYEKFLENLEEMPEKTIKALKKPLKKLGRQYIRKLTKSRLRGRPGLRRVTGNLARTISHLVQQSSDTGVFLRILFGAEYAATHEFGGTQKVSSTTVKAHLRGKAKVRSHKRRAYTREVPARLKARETMEDMGDEFVDELLNTVNEELESVDDQ